MAAGSTDSEQAASPALLMSESSAKPAPGEEIKETRSSRSFIKSDVVYRAVAEGGKASSSRLRASSGHPDGLLGEFGQLAPPEGQRAALPGPGVAPASPRLRTHWEGATAARSPPAGPGPPLGISPGSRHTQAADRGGGAALSDTHTPETPIIFSLTRCFCCPRLLTLRHSCQQASITTQNPHKNPSPGAAAAHTTD